MESRARVLRLSCVSPGCVAERYRTHRRCGYMCCPSHPAIWGIRLAPPLAEIRAREAGVATSAIAGPFLVLVVQ